MKYSFDDVDINGGVYGSTGLRVRIEVDEGEDLSIANNVQPLRLYRQHDFMDSSLVRANGLCPRYRGQGTWKEHWTPVRFLFPNQNIANIHRLELWYLKITT